MSIDEPEMTKKVLEEFVDEHKEYSSEEQIELYNEIRKNIKDYNINGNAKLEPKYQHENYEVKEKVTRSRQQYIGGEDPNFTWDDAKEIIVNVVGEEDGTFFYNGRLDVSMDDKGRKNYTIWKADPNAASTADEVIQAYTVYDDGTVEPN